MKPEVKTVLKKAAKITAATCITAGAVVLVTSKTALQAMLKGSEYLAGAVKKITKDEPQPEENDEVFAEPVQEETAAQPEGSAASEDNAESE